MKKINYSKAHARYLKKLKKEKALVAFWQIFVFIAFLGIWELFSSVGVLDPFFFSSPSRIATTLATLASSGNLWIHIWTSLYETVLGFIIAIVLGTIIAILLWWSERLRKIFEPYLIILNSLPKIALGPLIVLWVGSGTGATIVMCVLICIIITTMSMLGAFISCEQDKIMLMKSMHANKFQILFKLILPHSLPEFISVLKINVGLSCFYPTQSLRNNYSVSTQQKVFDTLIPTKSLISCIPYRKGITSLVIPFLFFVVLHWF